jgi:hypothetical protein
MRSTCLDSNARSKCKLIDPEFSSEQFSHLVGCPLRLRMLRQPFALAANVGNPPWVSIGMNGPELPLVRNASNDRSQPKADMAV